MITSRVTGIFTALAIHVFFDVASAQPAFQNLDFESVVLVPVPGDQFRRVEFGPAVPGWTGFIGN